MTPVRDGQLRSLLTGLRGLELTELDCNDECCTFCVSEAGISARMGQDRVANHLRHGTRVLTGGDMSCLMHLEGIVRWRQLPLQVRHAGPGLLLGLLPPSLPTTTPLLSPLIG